MAPKPSIIVSIFFFKIGYFNQNLVYFSVSSPIASIWPTILGKMGLAKLGPIADDQLEQPSAAQLALFSITLLPNVLAVTFMASKHLHQQTINL